MKNKGTYKDNESIVSSRLKLDMELLRDLAGQSNISQSEMDSVGLTDVAVDGLLEARYNKVFDDWGDYRSVWSYDCYESSAQVRIFLRQGDVGDELEAFRVVKSRSTNKWSITLIEI